MSSLGGAVFQGNSKLFEGPLGVVQVGYKGYDLGKTTADSNLVPEQDIKDILYQQDGTKAADHVRTGVDLMLNVTFGEISTGLLVLLMAGVTSENALTTDDSGTIDRVIYQSMRDNEGGVLRIAAVDVNGYPLSDVENLMSFYEAIPIVSGDLVNWGADTQRNFPVSFRIKWHEFSAGESTTKDGAFGYWGDPTTEDVPAITWPDVDGPQFVKATADSATNMDVEFNENIAFQTAFQTDQWFAKVNGDFVAPTGGVITLKEIALTFPAATFTSGDDIRIYMGPNELQDTDATPNKADAFDDNPVIDSVP
jgi:hypothetical protein